MTTVRETLAQLERQCLGLRVPYAQDPCWCGGEDHVIQYEITGPGGGVWHLAIELDECELLEGPTTSPWQIVRVPVEDWLALWADRVPAAALVESGRLTIRWPDHEGGDDRAQGMRDAADLARLGVLGPLRESGYGKLHDDDRGCADHETCPFPSHWEWHPPHLGKATRLSWLLAVTISIPIGIGVGLLFGGAFGLGSGLVLIRLGQAFIKDGLGQGMCRSPRFFRFLVDRKLVQPPYQARW